jgi:hypothetical protein
MMSDKDKRDAKRYRFIKKLARSETSSRDAYFWIMIRKEYGFNLFGRGSRPPKVTNYRTLSGAVDRMMRDAKGAR